MKPIVLASGSAIRRDILSGAGLDFDVVVKPVDERAIKDALLDEGVKMSDIADALAEAKSVRVSRDRPDTFVIGADQIMTMDEQLYDKPASLDEARDRLKRMRGREHQLIGAVVICHDGQAVWRHMSRTRLWVRNFTDTFLEDYIAREGDALTKSVGAYRFEGLGAQLFERVEGDFFSILGLSLLPVLDFLRMRGAIAA